MTTIADIHRKQQVRGRLALLMALDQLDAASARITALSHMVGDGVYSDGVHASAVMNIEKAMAELRTAERETAGFPDRGDA